MRNKLIGRIVVLLIFEAGFFARYTYLDEPVSATIGEPIPKRFDLYVVEDLMLYFLIAFLASSTIELFLLPKIQRYFRKSRRRSVGF